MTKSRTILASLVLLIAVGLTFALPGLTTDNHLRAGQNHSQFPGVHIAFAAGQVSSVKSGMWSDPSVWSTGRVPGTGDSVTINAGNTVTYDLTDSKVSGVDIPAGGKLVFAPSKTTLLKTDKNIVVYGELEMRPSSPTVHQTIRFVNVDESKFVGGGMNVVDTDIGLWIRDQGLLNVAGTPKTAWTRLQRSANAGSTSITLETTPAGWRVGDDISVVPTEHPKVGDASWNGFDERTITAISGNVVTLDAPLSHNHPAVTDPFSGATYTAEVLNLTRNVHIEGTGDGSADPTKNGRAHIQFKVTVPQFVSYAEFKLLGPRQFTGERNFTAGVLGRYAFHFHHGHDGTRGSVIEGTVVREAGFHSYVPHGSNGITFKDTIAYDVFDEAYWWDPPPVGDGADTSNNSDGIVYNHAVAAISKVDPPFRGTRNAGFVLGSGFNDEVRDSVAVGIQGTGDASGFFWLAGRANEPVGVGVWVFNRGNIGHNNEVDGIFTWQNNPDEHIVENAVVYHNGEVGVEHGAYVNRYQYINISSFGNGTYGAVLHAAAESDGGFRQDGYTLTFENYKTDMPLTFPRHSAAAALPTLFKDCIFPEIIVDDDTGTNRNPTIADFVNCTKPNGQSIEPADFTLLNFVPGLDIRVQRPDGTAYHIGDSGTVKSISPFYQGGTSQPINHSPSVDAGPVLTVGVGGTAALNGTVSDDGLPNPPGVVTTRWSMVSGPGSVAFGDANSVDTTATFTNAGTYQLQLFADDSSLTTTDQTTVTVAQTNQPPIVDAGQDQSLALTSTAIVTLNGVVSDDGLPNPPGAVATAWNVASGPGSVTFANQTAVSTTATFNSAGTYVLRLTADDSDKSSSDDVTITITQSSSSPNLVSNLSVVSGAAYQVVDNGLTTGAPMFIDRDYDVTSVPAGVDGITYIQTANDDKDMDDEPFMSFDVNQEVTVYVAYDSRSSSLPSWLSSWNNAGVSIGTTDVDFNLFSRTFASGGVSLGGNMASGASGAGSNYFVAVAADSLVTQPNEPPVVDAGSDVSISLPDSASLTGSVSDDGLPNPPGTVSTLWQMVSGPEPATFGSANLLSTSVSFTKAGIYLLSLFADDGELSSSDDLVVTVTRPNQSPVVDAGADQSVTLHSPATVTLNGSVSDDGLPNPPGVVSTLWTVLSGPGSVTFADDTALGTTATFTVAGTYDLMLSADDGEMLSTDNATITVLEPIQPLSVSNLSVASGKAYQVVDNGLTGNALIYIDRKYATTTVPASVDGATYIQTANSDKNRADDPFLSFSVNQAVTVYVAYDSRATSRPNWMSSWRNTGDTIGTTDVDFSLFAMDFASGNISLGGNNAPGAAGARSNYFVVITPQ